MGGISLDCAEPRALAAFYHELTGWPVGYDSDDYVFLDTGVGPGHGGHNLGVGFQRVAGHQPPTWPDGPVPAQAHLEFYVDDLAQAGPRLESLGAAEADVQPGGDRWRVYLDPAGHPFCIIVAGPST
jgi:catechol 2,3-dioxygenase-like lactoylglutathione lyase family enzyme